MEGPFAAATLANRREGTRWRTSFLPGCRPWDVTPWRDARVRNALRRDVNSLFDLLAGGEHQQRRQLGRNYRRLGWRSNRIQFFRVNNGRICLPSAQTVSPDDSWTIRRKVMFASYFIREMRHYVNKIASLSEVIWKAFFINVNVNEASCVTLETYMYTCILYAKAAQTLNVHRYLDASSLRCLFNRPRQWARGY